MELADFLKSSAIAKVDSNTFEVSRRAFISLSAGAMLATAPNAVGLARHLRVLCPDVRRQGRLIIVSLGSARWNIDPAQFGPGAKASLQQTPHGWRIALTSARLPGTDFAADLVAKIDAAPGGRIDVIMPAAGFRARIALATWLSRRQPLRSAVAISAIRLGRHVASLVSEADLAFSPDWLWHVSTNARDGVVYPLNGRTKVTAQGLRLRLPDPADPQIAAKLLARTVDRRTLFAFDEPALSGSALPLAHKLCPTRAVFRQDQVAAVWGDAFDRALTCGAAFVVKGSGAVRTPGRNGIALLHLDHAALAFLNGVPGAPRALAGTIKNALHSIQLDDLQALVSGDSESAFFASFSRGSSDFGARMALHRLHIPSPGASQAFVEFDGRPTDIVYGPPATTRPVPNAEPHIAVTGKGAVASIDLTGARLRLRRGADHFDLTFTCVNFNLETSFGTTRLVRRHAPGQVISWPEALITAHFAPQHIADTWVHFDPAGYNVTVPVKSRMSGPSQLVFTAGMDGKRPVWKERPFTIEALTDWSDLDASVNARAAPPSLPLDTASCGKPVPCLDHPGGQMGIPNIGTKTTEADAFAALARSMTPPTAYQSWFEPVPRLLASAAAIGGYKIVNAKADPIPLKAGWSTPRERPDAKRALLWSARLDEYGRKAVRIIWSRMLPPGQYPPQPVEPIGSDPELLIVQPEDQWELVAQMSLFGAPAKRWAGASSSSSGGLDTLPKSTVLPAPDYNYLKKLSDPPEDVGIFQPSVFADADCSLSAMGGNFNMRWRGKPPTFLWPGSTLRRALSWIVPSENAVAFGVQEFTLLVRYSFTIDAKVVKRGFLFPLGIPAAWLEWWHREIVFNKTTRRWTALLIKHTRIVVEQPEKHWPALYQPNSSREFPASKLSILTLESPDILDPRIASATTWVGRGVHQTKQGRLVFDGADPNTFIFWPTLFNQPSGSATATVPYKWTLDDNPTPVGSPLLFVEVKAAINADLMAQLVDYYRNQLTSLDPLRQASFAGSRQRYAPAGDAGKEVAYDTDHWVLGVEGRRSADTGGENFVFDAHMDSVDQPPFYPRVHRARIKLQTIEHLLGHPVGLAEVAYPAIYTRDGFNTTSNKAEIYLEIFSPDIDMDPAAAGLQGSAGSVANPSMRLAAFSRRFGSIGGTGSTRAEPAQQTALTRRLSLLAPRARRVAAAAPAANATSPYDYSEAQRGNMAPKQWLGQLLNSQLLGAVSIKDLVEPGSLDDKSAPALIETVQYAAGAVEGGLSDTLRKVATTLGDPLEQALQFLDGLKTEFNNHSNQIKFADLYPDLDSRSTAAETELKATLAVIANGASDSVLIDRVTATMLTMKALLSEAERVAANPTPPLVDKEITSLVTTWQDLKKLFQGQFVTKSDFQRLKSPIVDLLNKVSADGLAEALLGYDPLKWSDAVDDPSAWSDAVGSALFSESFGSGISTFLLYLKSIEDEFEARLTLPEADFAAALLPVVASAVDALGEQLAIGAAILTAAGQRALLDACRSAIELVLKQSADALPSASTINQAIANLRTIVAAATPAAIAGVVRTAIDQRKSDFAVDANGDQAAILAAFEAAAIPAIASAAERLLIDEARRFEGELGQILASPATAVRKLAELLQATGIAMSTAAQVAALSGAGQAATGWCSAAAGGARRAVDFADDIASGLLDDATTIAKACADLLQEVQFIAAPAGASPILIAQYDTIKRRLAASVQDIAVILLQLAEARSQLTAIRTSADDPAQSSICENPGSFLALAGNVITLQRDVARAIGQLGPLLAKLNDLVDGATIAAIICAKAVELAGMVNGADRVTTTSPAWNKVRSACIQIGTAIGGNFKTSLDDLVAEAAVEAKAVRAALAKATVATLASVTGGGEVFIESQVRHLAGFVLQTVAFDAATVRQVAGWTASVLGTIAEILDKLHLAVLTPLTAIINVLNGDAIKQIIRPEVVLQFKAAQGKIVGDEQQLADIRRVATQLGKDAQQAATPLSKMIADINDLISRSVGLVDQWSHTPPALASSIEVVTTIVTEILRGDIGAVLNIPDLHMILAQIEQQGEALIASIVPTSVNLNYSWKTPLGSYPSGGSDDALFKMQKDETGLTLSAQVQVDLLKQTRTATVTGTIDPFQIHLFGSADIATIFFDTTKFESVNGSTPHFSTRVTNVELGTLMEFISALQEYFGQGDEDNGFYIKASPVEIEAGYVYSAPLIIVGELEFINVALKVAARLPFDGRMAEFEFDFASAEQPFLIAAPPYGGGGYVKLVSTINGIQRFELAFVFGGVAAIKFGPLKAQGRLLAGVTLLQAGDERRIRATVQAVGEGNIACFGICVAITVGIEQEGEGSDLVGFSDYSFSFHVGWLKLSYGFRASYRVSGGSGGSHSMRLVAAGVKGPAPANIRRYRNHVPHKLRDWQNYTSRYSMELLES